MMGVHVAIHVPVPSVSSQAVLTMPILVPLSDLLGIARQVTVLAYQYGAGLCDLITPTNGSLMAVLAAAGVPYDRWFRFVLPLFLILFLTGAAAVAASLPALPAPARTTRILSTHPRSPPPNSTARRW